MLKSYFIKKRPPTLGAISFSQNLLVVYNVLINVRQRNLLVNYHFPVQMSEELMLFYFLKARSFIRISS